MTGRPALFQRLFALTGKTALITGATGGIGQVLAAALAEAGATVGVHGRTQEKVENLCASIAEGPGREEKGGRRSPSSPTWARLMPVANSLPRPIKPWVD